MTEMENLGILDAVKTHFEMIPLELIDDPVRPMRTDMSHESIHELARSIKQVGLIEPVVVKPVGERYEVVAGHRRITACEHAGHTPVECHVVIGTEEQVEMMKIHENLMRVDVNPYDEAQHYDRLMRDMKLSPARIAQLTNRGDQYVRDRLAILTYNEELQQAVAIGKIRLGVAKELNRITDPMKQREMLGYAMKQGITQAVAKRWVEDEQPDKRPDSTFVPDFSAVDGVVPASEQHTACFYCMQPVRLIDAYSVMVHNECMAARQAAPGSAAEEIEHA